MRTAMRSDAPSASESGTRMVVLTRHGADRLRPGRRARAAPTPSTRSRPRPRRPTPATAAAPVRARLRRPAARDVPDQPDHRVDGGDGHHRPDARSRGRSFTRYTATDRRWPSSPRPSRAGAAACGAHRRAVRAPGADRRPGATRSPTARIPAPEVAHGVGGDVAAGERGAEQQRGADDRASAMTAASGSRGRCAATNTAASAHAPTSTTLSTRPGPSGTRSPTNTAITARAARATAASTTARGGARRPRRTLAHVVADARRAPGVGRRRGWWPRSLRS